MTTTTTNRNNFKSIIFSNQEVVTLVFALRHYSRKLKIESLDLSAEIRNNKKHLEYDLNLLNEKINKINELSRIVEQTFDVVQKQLEKENN